MAILFPAARKETKGRNFGLSRRTWLSFVFLWPLSCGETRLVATEFNEPGVNTPIVGSGGSDESGASGGNAGSAESGGAPIVGDAAAT